MITERGCNVSNFYSESLKLSFQKAFQSGIKGNVLISPISVKILLTLLAESAKQNVESETRTQLAIVLPYNHTLEASRIYFKNILSSLEVIKRFT